MRHLINANLCLHTWIVILSLFSQSYLSRTQHVLWQSTFPYARAQQAYPKLSFMPRAFSATFLSYELECLGIWNARNVDFWQLTFVVATTGPLDFSAIKLNRGCMRNSLNLTSSGADDYTRTRLLRSKGVNSHYKKGQEWVDQILKTPKETPYGSV